MKRAMIGGVLSLLGTIWGIAALLYAGSHLVSAWTTPPGRFWSTVLETGMVFPLLFSFVLLVLGLAAMGVEYFRKEG